MILDSEKHECKIDGKIIDLTMTEFKILELFLSRKGFVFTREKLLNHLWGDDKIVVDRTIDVHIKNLRTKIGVYGKNIQNIRGVGYKFVEEI